LRRKPVEVFGGGGCLRSGAKPTGHGSADDFLIARENQTAFCSGRPQRELRAAILISGITNRTAK
jgi:hypothetical protein